MPSDIKPEIEQLAAAARRKPLRAIRKYQKLIENLHGDLEKHGDPEHWKRYGDLLLANAENAKRKENSIWVKDLFDEAVPLIEIEGESNRSISEVAESYFRRYTKARNAVAVIKGRKENAEAGIDREQAVLKQIDEAVAAGDPEYLAGLAEPSKQPARPAGKRKKAAAAFTGARRFISSDGLMILVGKRAADNDYLTFRVARSLDTWLHAADYPGSHVIIHSPNRGFVIPDRTLTEAAQLAAFYSDARSQPKAAVRYTQKKFVNKPRRAAPGLVSLASFKTILVEPKVGDVVRETSQ